MKKTHMVIPIFQHQLQGTSLAVDVSVTGQHERLAWTGESFEFWQKLAAKI